MDVEAVGDQRHADQHQEGERQHLGGRMVGDEMRDRPGGGIHHDHRDHHGGDHDLEILRHADGGDDGIEREHEVDQGELA